MQKTMYSVVLTALLLCSCAMLGCRKTPERSDYHPSVVPDVSSTQLSGTAIVPTLDTMLPEPGNAAWCTTFQVAWNHARDNVIGGPLSIANAQPVADRLNGSPVTEAVLPPGSYCAVAGRLEDGIIETIRSIMFRRFPDVQPPDFGAAVGFVTYGYLETSAAFTIPFTDTKQPIQFIDGTGVKHPVSAFGLHEGTDWTLRSKQAAQVRVLFSETYDKSDQLKWFAIDLTADQADQEVIVAVLPRAENLRAALGDLARRIETSAPDQYEATLQSTDTLAIPNVAFHVHHEFAELQGVDKRIENPGEFQDLYILKALQSIRFRLDKSGASVISESHMYPTSTSRPFVVDRPFLIVMKRRSADQPYFVAWIDNAELFP